MLFTLTTLDANKMFELLKSSLDKLKDVNKYQKRFILALINAIAVCQGKVNFKNMSRYSDISEKCFNRWHSKAFNFFKLNCLILFSKVRVSTELILALDASFIPKSGKKTEGLAKFYNGSNQKSEKGLEVSLLSLVDVNTRTAYSLDAKQTIDTQGISRISLYVKQVIKCIKNLKNKGIKYLTVDAYYFKKNLCNLY